MSSIQQIRLFSSPTKGASANVMPSFFCFCYYGHCVRICDQSHKFILLLDSTDRTGDTWPHHQDWHDNIQGRRSGRDDSRHEDNVNKQRLFLTGVAHHITEVLPMFLDKISCVQAAAVVPPPHLIERQRCCCWSLRLVGWICPAGLDAQFRIIVYIWFFLSTYIYF